MTVNEQIKYNKSVIAVAKDWVNGKSSINGVEELTIIADHYNVDLPRCITNFVRSENPDHIEATSTQKTLLSLMKRLKKAVNRKSLVH